jgi:5,10-methylenetetrahydrofolate reductase
LPFYFILIFLLFSSAISLKKIASISNVPIPEKVTRILEENKGNLAAIQNYSVHLAFEMSKEILGEGLSKGIHIFTLNQREMCR